MSRMSRTSIAKAALPKAVTAGRAVIVGVAEIAAVVEDVLAVADGDAVVADAVAAGDGMAAVVMADMEATAGDGTRTFATDLNGYSRTKTR